MDIESNVPMNSQTNMVNSSSWIYCLVVSGIACLVFFAAGLADAIANDPDINDNAAERAKYSRYEWMTLPLFETSGAVLCVTIFLARRLHRRTK